MNQSSSKRFRTHRRAKSENWGRFFYVFSFTHGQSIFVTKGCGPWKSSSFSVPSYSGKQMVFMDGGIPQTATTFVFRTHQVGCITYNRSGQTPNPFVCTAKWQSVGVASPFFPAALQEHHQRAGLSELYFETGTMSYLSWRRKVVASHTLWSSLIRISPTQGLGC